MLWTTRSPGTPHRAVVHLHGHRDLDALLAVREDLDQVRVDGERLADAPQLGLGELERVLARCVGEGQQRSCGGAFAHDDATIPRPSTCGAGGSAALPYGITNGTVLVGRSAADGVP